MPGREQIFNKCQPVVFPPIATFSLGNPVFTFIHVVKNCRVFTSCFGRLTRTRLVFRLGFISPSVGYNASFLSRQNNCNNSVPLVQKPKSCEHFLTVSSTRSCRVNGQWTMTLKIVAICPMLRAEMVRRFQYISPCFICTIPLSTRKVDTVVLATF